MERVFMNDESEAGNGKEELAGNGEKGDQSNGTGAEGFAKENRRGNGAGAQVFANAAGFGNGAGAGKVDTWEDVYLWEHGVEVEPWPEAVNGKELLDEIEGCFKRFAVLPKWGSETLSLWDLHTFAFPLRLVTTYIGLESPEKRCGKTTVLTVLSELVNRPIVASNISSPAFFRVIADKKPTLLIDEADTVLHRNKELRGILNSGYTRRMAYVIRMRPKSRTKSGGQSQANGDGVVQNGAEGKAWDDGLEASRYSSWCPKAIATIRHLPETLADRCIVIPMQRKSVHEKCERLRNLKGTDLRRKCARFVMDHAEEIAGATPEIPEDLNDRAADIWEPLFVLADLAGGDWPEKARRAALGLTAAAQEESPIGSLLLDLMVQFIRERCASNGAWTEENGGARIFSRDLAASLNYYTGRPWQALVRGKVTEMWLSQQLRPYGMRPRTIWIGEQSAKGYVEGDFTEAFRRYIPKTAMQRLLDESAAAKRERELSQ
jgi:hypothetical protein